MIAGMGRLAIAAGAVLALGSELLSLFHLFSFWPTLALWSLTGAACVWLTWRRHGVHRSVVISHLKALRADEGILLATIALLLGCAFLSGLFSPPNSWDSMVSHLPRQVRWIQQGSLEHFPSHAVQQLSRGSFAETLQAGLQLLTGTDLVTQFVSWGALVLCLLYGSLLGGRLGVSRRGRLLAALLCLGVPIAFLEASTTKNDLVVAAWSLAVIWLVFGAIQTGHLTRTDALLTGLALGLAGLTKSTAYLLMAPFIPVLAFALLHGRTRIVSGILILAAFLSVNAGHWVRNTRTFGFPTGPDSIRRIHMNSQMSPTRFLSRVAKEASLELATPFGSANRLVEAAIRTWHERLGVDVLDPATTYPDRRFQVLFLPASEYQAAAPLHFLLLMLLPVGGLLLRHRLPGAWWLPALLPWAIFFWLSLVSKWEPYLNPRLHLLLFFVAAPAMTALLETALHQPGALERIGPRETSGLVLAVAALLLLQLVPSAVSSPRSVLGPVFRPRSELLFVEGPHLRPIYERAASAVRSCRPEVVGIDSRGDWAWEYPLMRLLRRGQYEPLFVSVNPSLVPARPYPAPDVVVVFRRVESYTDRRSGRSYRAFGHFGFLTVLR